MRVFDDLNSSVIYGQLVHQDVVHGMFCCSSELFFPYNSINVTSRSYIADNRRCERREENSTFLY